MAQSNKPTNTATYCAICIVTLFLLAVGLSTQRTSTLPKPGPTTTALCDRMKSYEMQSALTFTQQFGMPDKTNETTVQDVSYFLCTYQCSDGYVLVAMNQSLGIVESVDAFALEGKRAEP